MGVGGGGGGGSGGGGGGDGVGGSGGRVGRGFDCTSQRKDNVHAARKEAKTRPVLTPLAASSSMDPNPSNRCLWLYTSKYASAAPNRPETERWKWRLVPVVSEGSLTPSYMLNYHPVRPSCNFRCRTSAACNLLICILFCVCLVPHLSLSSTIPLCLHPYFPKHSSLSIPPPVSPDEPLLISFIALVLFVCFFSCSLFHRPQTRTRCSFFTVSTQRKFFLFSKLILIHTPAQS